MLNRFARRLLPIGAFCALAFAAAPSPAGARLTVGVSDNIPSMFSEHSFLRLHVRIARDIVEWNVAVTRNHAGLNEVRDWLNAARAAHVTPMISFNADPGAAGNYIPSIPVYTAAIKAFIHDFPWAKTYTPWNEPDFIYRNLAKN